MNVRTFIAGMAGILVLVAGTAAQAQICEPAIEVDVLPAFGDTLADITAGRPLSEFDLIAEMPGTDEGLEARELFLDYIDEANDIFAWHLAFWAGGCMALRPGQYDQGFHPCCSGDLADLTDGIPGSLTDAVLRDFAKASLVVRYDFDTPTDVGVVRVFSANEDPAAVGNARVFHHYDLFASTDGGVNYFCVAREVKAGSFGQINSDDIRATMSEVHNRNAPELIEACTNIRFVFYCVGNAPLGAPGRFQDDYNGSFNEDPGWIADCESFDEDGDVDGFRRAFEASIIKEVDVFAVDTAEAPTPWADIDYDGDTDLIDFGAFQECFETPTVGENGCYRFDLNTDNAVDLGDLPEFEALLSGPA